MHGMYDGLCTALTLPGLNRLHTFAVSSRVIVLPEACCAPFCAGELIWFGALAWTGAMCAGAWFWPPAGPNRLHALVWPVAPGAFCALTVLAVACSACEVI